MEENANTQQGAESSETEVNTQQETVNPEQTGAIDSKKIEENGESQSDTGALGQVNDAEVKQDEAVDYAKMTDDEYVSKLEKIEGLDAEQFSKKYAKFCRDEKLSPELVSRYLKVEKANIDEMRKAYDAEHEKEMKAFQEEGVSLRKEFNPQQIQSAIRGLRSIGADDKFMKYATKELSNNKTLVKLLMNWNETHSEDGTPGVGGTAQSTEKTFEQVWTGK